MKISPFSEFLLQTLILTDFHYFARRLWDSWESSRSIWIVTLKLSKGPWDPAKPSALQIKTVGHIYFDIKEYKVKSENSPKISIFCDLASRAPIFWDHLTSETPILASKHRMTTSKVSEWSPETRSTKRTSNQGHTMFTSEYIQNFRK